MKPVWIVDDDASIRYVLEKALARAQLPVRSFADAGELMAALQHEEPQVLLTDIRMPGVSGLELLARVKARLPGLPVIVTTAYSDLDSAVGSFEAGAFDYLPKPFDLEQAVAMVRRAIEESQRERAADAQADEAGPLLGRAPAMQELFRAIGRLGASQATVLITGESGSGKELVAQALHRHGTRGQATGAAPRPFVAINTAAIPQELLESELFGHERGAFTGAQAMRRGRFEQAEGGTLFLDEIGDMPLALQTRLLRVLSDGQFYRVGGHHPLLAKVRVIAATHQDLEQRVREGGFREDLYHRLNVIRLRLPPLRERREDVPLLVRHFLARSARELDVAPKRIGEAALQRLQAFDFPGNVRQLQNICHWLTVMAPGRTIAVADLPPELHAQPRSEPQTAAAAATAAATVAAPPASAGELPAAAAASADAQDWRPLLEQALCRRLAAGEPEPWNTLTREFETQLIRTALALTEGRRIEAAQRLGIGRNTITRKIQDYGLDD